jgi:hypothetical protein
MELTTPDREYAQVRGWLLFLCIVLSVVIPISSALELIATWQLEREVAALAPGVTTIAWLHSALLVLIAFLGFIAGVVLWLRRHRAVAIAHVCLVAILCATVTMLGVLLVVDIPQSVREALVRQEVRATIRTAVFVVVWFTYLLRSYRVKRTYASSP